MVKEEKDKRAITSVTASELRAFETVARLSGQSLSAWIRVQLRLAVARTISADLLESDSEDTVTQSVAS